MFKPVKRLTKHRFALGRSKPAIDNRAPKKPKFLIDRKKQKMQKKIDDDHIMHDNQL